MLTALPWERRTSKGSRRKRMEVGGARMREEIVLVAVGVRIHIKETRRMLYRG